MIPTETLLGLLSTLKRIEKHFPEEVSDEETDSENTVLNAFCFGTQSMLWAHTPSSLVTYPPKPSFPTSHGPARMSSRYIVMVSEGGKLLTGSPGLVPGVHTSPEYLLIPTLHTAAESL